ncbi:MAG TPA: PAS domain S-box protein [Spirochaetota bacterium]|nr:PAS domain S-box protein [Spirochaetota bacterium]
MSDHRKDSGEPVHSVALEQAIDSANIGVCLCDEKGIIEKINLTASEILSAKLDAGKAAFAGENISDIDPGIGAAAKKSGEIEGPAVHEFSITKADGSLVWISCEARCGETAERKKIVIIFLQDISQHKQCEIQLQRSQKKLASIVDTIPDIVYRVDPKGVITFINNAVREYGYEPDELIGTNFIDLVHPDDRGKALHRINERRTGERKTRCFEVRMFTKKKEIVSFELKDNSVQGDQVFQINSEGIYLSCENDTRFFIGTQGVARDITKRKHIENELFENKERWISILNSLEDGYYEVDLGGNFIFANKAFCDITGQEYDEIIGLNYRNLFSYADVDVIFKTFNEVYKTGEQAKLLNWEIIRKDGKKRNIEGSVSLGRDINGQSRGFRGIVRDATEKMKIQQELLRARKLEAIGILAGGIAHDYNNALTAIMGNISLAKMESEKNPQLMDILNDAEKASIKVMELTKRLSSFAKGGRPVKKQIDMAAFIRETVDSVLFKFTGRYELSIAKDIWNLDIDEIQISHVIENLLNNAVEAVDTKGLIRVTAANMTVEKEESHHEISLQPGKYVVITLSDNGPGIPAEIIGNIFDPYFSTKEFASGMGLATSYAIIKRHRGYIDVKSDAGAGTTFHVYLPLQD